MTEINFDESQRIEFFLAFFLSKVREKKIAWEHWGMENERILVGQL